MRSANFGSLTGPIGLGPKMGMGARIGLPRMKTGRGLGVPSMGGLGVLKFAAGGYASGGPSMTSIAIENGLHGMPYHTIPDYLMSRLAGGGQPEGGLSALSMMDSERPSRMRRLARPVNQPYFPGINRIPSPLTSMKDILDDLSPEDRAGLDSMSERERMKAMLETQNALRRDNLADAFSTQRGPDARDRQRGALEDKVNESYVNRDEATRSAGDLVGSMLDPTTLPLGWWGLGSAGARSALGRALGFGKVPGGFKPTATTLGMYMGMPEFIGEASPSQEAIEAKLLERGMYRTPQNFRLIGDR